MSVLDDHCCYECLGYTIFLLHGTDAYVVGDSGLDNSLSIECPPFLLATLLVSVPYSLGFVIVNEVRLFPDS
jgi:hypothetical protein